MVNKYMPYTCTNILLLIYQKNNVQFSLGSYYILTQWMRFIRAFSLLIISTNKNTSIFFKCLVLVIGIAS